MSDKQLQMVADWEREKENKCVRDFVVAQQHADLNKQKLQSLEQYRLQYLRETQLKANAGLEAQSYHQHLSFIAKLDVACEQQTKVHSQALLVAEQRKDIWLKQQRKRKAVDMLLDKKAKARQLKADKQEQLLLDELALQKHVRK